MNQKSTVEQVLEFNEWLLEQYHDDILVGKHFGVDRELYDPSGDIADIQACINGLNQLLKVWDIVLENDITDPEIIQPIVLPIQFYKGRQWVDPLDIKIAVANAVFVH